METFRLKNQAIKKIKQGYPLLQAGDFENQLNEARLPEGQWVKFTDSKNTYQAAGYLGRQNKGIGWILTTDPQEQISESFFVRLFKQAQDHRKMYFLDPMTTAFRLFNGEGDGAGGLTIDLYADFAVISWYNSSIYQQKKLILAAFLEVYPEIAGIYEKIRFENQNLTDSQFIYGVPAAEPLIVLENGVRFAVYLNEGCMTGIFLDQKEVRGALIEGVSAGKSLLNTFSYTGAFSVAAAMGGAIETTSVDLAKRSLAKTKEQFALNQLDLSNQRILVMDVFDFFRYAKRAGYTYDMIVLDPPSFARNKKKTFSVIKDYGKLVTEAVDLVKDGGLLFASTNAANLTMKKYKQMVEQALLEKGYPFLLKETYQLPADFRVTAAFPEGNYLKVLVYQITQ